MPQNNPQFAAMMVGLRQKYVAQLKERHPQIAEFLTRCEQKQVTEEDRQHMRQRAHSLAGSGATYGFADISTAGRALEGALDAQDTEQDLIPLVRALLDACEQTLAASPDAATPKAVTAAPAATEKPSPAASRKLTLLTVDDDPAVRDLMASLFAQEARVLTATDGKEALAIIREQRPDLVLLDETMPEMSGMELLETLHKEPELSGTAIVMITANDRSKDVMRAIAAGALDYITKPFDPQAVAGKVRTLLKRFSQTILIADDDAPIRDLLAARFRMGGIRVLEARDGAEALKLAQTHKPNLALLDRMMPALDGMALLQKLKADPATKAIPVIFLTAKRQENDIIEGLKLGAADYIVKPFSPDEVVTRCMRLLEAEGS